MQKRLNFVLTILLVFSLSSICIVFFIFARLYSNDIIEKFIYDSHEQMRRICTNFTNNLPDSLYNEFIKSHTYLKSIDIFIENNNSFVSMINKKQKLKPDIESRLSTSKRIDIMNKQYLVTYLLSQKIVNKKKICIKLVFDFSSFYSLQKNILFISFLASFFLIFISIIIFYKFIKLYLIDRLKKIDQKLENIEIEKNLKDINSKWDDEISQLLITINRVIEIKNNKEAKLKKKIDKQKEIIHKYVKALDFANQDLVQEAIDRKIMENALISNKEHAENEREAAQEANKRIMDSLRYAKLIQSSLLPGNNYLDEYTPFSFFIWTPRDVVGGDLYDLYPLNMSFISYDDGRMGVENGIIIIVIDCTGHGVPGALMTMIASSGLKRIIQDLGCHDPAEILHQLNVIVKKTLHQDTEHALSDDGMDVSICFLKPEEKKLIYAGARLPLIYIYNDELTLIKGDKQSVGYKKSDIDFVFTNHEIEIKENTSFYMYSDGFVDQLGGMKGLPFGNKRFKSLIKEIYLESFEDQKGILLKTFEEYKGNYEQKDDITIVGFGF